MSSCLERYRICCRCATVDLPDYTIDIGSTSSINSVLENFLRHFNFPLSETNLAVAILIYSGRRLELNATVGDVFGSLSVCIHSCH
jgi:hypothetical protein